MPWHGLAVNGELTTLADGIKTITKSPDNFDEWGPCVVVRHPSAPGASARTTEQLAKDATHGYDWRDYALLTGINKTVNGAVDLGAKSWLYIDPAGVTWLLRLDITANVNDVTFEVVRVAAFGRFGIQRTYSDTVIASLVWAPDIPSWYTGSVTAADVVQKIDVFRHYNLCPNEDGTLAYFNIHCFDFDYNRDLYLETTPMGEYTVGDNSRALIGVLKIDVSGTGDLDNNGDGVAATCVEHYTFEGGLVTARVRELATVTGSYATITNTNLSSAPAYPGDPPPDVTEPFTEVQTLTVQGQEKTDYKWQYSAILYVTPHGEVTRTENDDYYEYKEYIEPQGQISYDWELKNFLDGPDYSTKFVPYGWQYAYCVGWSGTTGLVCYFRQGTYRNRTTSYSVFGVNVQLTYVQDDWHDDDYIAETQDDCDGVAQYPTGFRADRDQKSRTVDGVAITDTTANPTVLHQWRPLGQNEAWLAMYRSQTPGNVNEKEMEERLIVKPESAGAKVGWTGAYNSTHSWLNPSTPALPYVRQWIGSYQPVDDTLVSYSWDTIGLYGGDVYQYC